MTPRGFPGERGAGNSELGGQEISHPEVFPKLGSPSPVINNVPIFTIVEEFVCAVGTISVKEKQPLANEYLSKCLTQSRDNSSFE